MRPATQWVAEPPAGWILYDGDCGFCSRLAWWAARFVLRKGFHLAPLQAPWVRQRLALPEEKLLEEVRVLTADDALYSGADALVFLARQCPWARRLTPLVRVPGVMWLFRAAYRIVARNRHRLSRACALSASTSPRPPVRQAPGANR